MLVISRRINETIVINNNIYITITRIGNSQVKVGIEAPENVRVSREEPCGKVIRKTISLEEKDLSR
jgi:carbon storage regulator